MFDKKGQKLTIDDICICNKYLVQIKCFPSIGVGIDVRDIYGGADHIDLNCLK